MDKRTPWPAIQAITGIYCAILGTVSFLFPAQPGQPIWQSVVRVSAPPTFAIAMLLLGIAVSGPAITGAIKAVRKRGKFDDRDRSQQKKLDDIEPELKTAIEERNAAIDEVAALRAKIANFKIQAITGSLSNIRIKRHGITSGSGGDRKVVCELSIGIALQHSEREPVEIAQMSLTTWPSTDRPVRTLEIQSPLGIPFALEEGRSHAFMLDAQIEFADDGSHTIPPSLSVMVVDKYNGRHFIPLDHGQALPKLP